MNTIYNYQYRDNKLWKKINPSIQFKSSEIIDKQILKTKSKTNNEFIIKEFILSKNYLFYLKNNAIKGYVELNNIGIEYSVKEKKISLFNNNKYFTLFFEDSIITKKWKDSLKKRGILNNFQKFYEIIGKLGDGGNAQVYLAKKTKNQKEYAVKIISKVNIRDKNYLNSLINEIKILRKLDHKNVTKYYALFESKNNFYLVINYCNSKTLKEFVKNKSSTNDKLSLINQIIDALIYIHSLNLVHRDLKPENILLNRDLNGKLFVKIGDFGLSNFLDEQFIFKKCGTPGFISPEILNYNKSFEYKITKKVDIYSMGHIIHYIFTSLNIFEHEDLNELLSKNQKNKFKIFKNLNKNIKKIIESCLILNPKKRVELENLKQLINKIN